MDDGIHAMGTLPDFPQNREVQYKDILPNKETAGAILALMQLIQLRNCYNGVWEPDLNEDEPKYVIVNKQGNLHKIRNATINHVLTFKSEELCDQFLENFRDLIETAKSLI